MKISPKNIFLLGNLNKKNFHNTYQFHNKQRKIKNDFYCIHIWKFFNAGFEFHHLSLPLWIQILLHPHHCPINNGNNNVNKQLTVHKTGQHYATVGQKIKKN